MPDADHAPAFCSFCRESLPGRSRNGAGVVQRAVWSHVGGAGSAAVPRRRRRQRRVDSSRHTVPPACSSSVWCAPQAIVSRSRYLGWTGGNDLSGLAHHLPDDPANALVAAYHGYPDKACASAACWNRVLRPLVAIMPVLAAEVGERGCRSTFSRSFVAWADAFRGVRRGVDLESLGLLGRAGLARVAEWHAHRVRRILARASANGSGVIPLVG